MRKKITLSIICLVTILLYNKQCFGSNILAQLNLKSALNSITMTSLITYDLYFDKGQNDKQYQYLTSAGFKLEVDEPVYRDLNGGIISSYNTAGMKELLIKKANADSYGFSTSKIFEKSSLYGVIGNTKETYSGDNAKDAWPEKGGTAAYSRTYFFAWRQKNIVYIGCSVIVNNVGGVWSDASARIYSKEIMNSPSKLHLSWYEPTNSNNQYKADVEQIAKNSAKTGETISNIKISGNWTTNNDFTKGNKQVICEVKKSDSKTYKRSILLEWDNIYDLIWYTKNENDVLYKDENGKEVKTEGEAEQEANENATQTTKKNYARVLSLSDAGSDRTQTTFTDVLSNPDSYKPGQITDQDSADVSTMGRMILGAINIIGIVASVIIIATLGIKYILGSIEEKAELKEGLIPYIIGIVLLIGIPTIVNVLYNFGVSLYK